MNIKLVNKLYIHFLKHSVCNSHRLSGYGTSNTLQTGKYDTLYNCILSKSISFRCVELKKYI